MQLLITTRLITLHKRLCLIKKRNEFETLTAVDLVRPVFTIVDRIADTRSIDADRIATGKLIRGTS